MMAALVFNELISPEQDNSNFVKRKSDGYLKHYQVSMKMPFSENG